MFFSSTTNLLKNIVSLSIVLVLFLYQRDESIPEDDTAALIQQNFLERYQEKMLKNRVNIGLSTRYMIKLEQSTNDSRQL